MPVTKSQRSKAALAAVRAYAIACGRTEMTVDVFDKIEKEYLLEVSGAIEDCFVSVEEGDDFVVDDEGSYEDDLDEEEEVEDDDEDDDEDDEDWEETVVEGKRFVDGE
jgi:hypothetical protein